MVHITFLFAFAKQKRKFVTLLATALSAVHLEILSISLSCFVASSSSTLFLRVDAFDSARTFFSKQFK